MAVIYLLRFGGQLAGQHTVAATPGGRPHRARARGLRGPSPPHTHAPQLLRYRIGAYGREATRVPLYTVLSYYLLLTNPGFSCHPWSWHCLLSSSRTSPTLRT